MAGPGPRPHSPRHPGALPGGNPQVHVRHGVLRRWRRRAIRPGLWGSLRLHVLTAAGAAAGAPAVPAVLAAGAPAHPAKGPPPPPAPALLLLWRKGRSEVLAPRVQPGDRPARPLAGGPRGGERGTGSPPSRRLRGERSGRPGRVSLSALGCREGGALPESRLPRPRPQPPRVTLTHRRRASGQLPAKPHPGHDLPLAQALGVCPVWELRGYFRPVTCRSREHGITPYRRFW